MRGASYMRLISWTLRSVCEQRTLMITWRSGWMIMFYFSLGVIILLDYNIIWLDDNIRLFICPVPAILSPMPCPSCDVLAVIFWRSVLSVLSRVTCSKCPAPDYPVPAVLYWLLCHTSLLSVLSPTILSQLSCTGCCATLLSSLSCPIMSQSR